MSIQAKFAIQRGDFTLDVDLDVPANGVTALYGPSGCGKSSLLRAIAGLEHHAGGYLKVGESTWQQGDQFTAPHERPFAYVFQEASLFPHLNVQRNLEYGYKRVANDQRRISLEQATELLGIQDLLKRKPHNLSGGERQRVAIARALCVSPQFLLMDEPLAALDQASKQEILPYLESLHNTLKIPIFYVSHTMEEIARLADHLVLFEKGKIIASGPINSMLTRLDQPLAHGSDASAIFEATVSGFDETYHLTHLDFAGGRFSAPGMSLQLGQTVRVRIAARDVSLTLERQASTSIQNIFPAVIDETTAEGDAQVTVRLQVGSDALLSRITQKSSAELDVKPGKQVFAQVKSAVLLA
ncbi:MAG: molybdenum ABC transporter ATP-binding protein [Planctomycetes bacterium]|nr:molybdenum ABC transporter ATP-binding protein [Planctomycetota bacterium]MCP4770514.1 molybdenum ABC transporter ATP-binding protein [Planctomycetota bacterium]MCP4859954.1 molybdenum ABC transporter ATP-binding protein [Planctomycetota bacterium]